MYSTLRPIGTFALFAALVATPFDGLAQNSALDALMSKVETRIEALREERRIDKEALEAGAAQIEELQAGLANLVRARDQLSADLTRASEQLAQATDARAALEEELRLTKSDADATIAALTEELKATTSDAIALRETLQQSREAEAEATGQFEAQLAALKGEASDLEAALDEQKTGRQAAEAELASVRARLTRLDEILGEAEADPTVDLAADQR